MRKAVWLTVLLLCISTADGTAVAQNTLTLADLYQLAAAHPSIKAARAANNAAGHSVGDAWFGLLPRASVVHQRDLIRQEVIQTENPVYQAGIGHYRNALRTLEITWPVLDARNFAQLGVAYAVARRSKHLRTQAEQRIIYSAIEAYLLTLAAFDSFRLASSEVRALQERANEIDVRLARGLGNESERDEVQSRLARAKAQQIASVAAVGEAYAAMRRVGGFDVGNLFALRSRFPMARPDPASPDAWVLAAYETNPELKALEASISEAKANLAKSVAGTLPRVDMRYSDNYLDAGGSLYGGGAKTDERNVSLRLTIPLFNPDGLGYPMFAAREKVDELKYNVEDRRRTIEEKIRTAYLEVLANATRDAILVKAADHQRKLVLALRERFRAGLGTTTIILDAERDYFKAQREVLSGRYNYLLNMMQLKQLSGLIGVDDVLYVNSLLDTKGRPVGKISLR